MVVDLTVAADVADLVEEDLRLVEIEAETVKCSRLSAQTAEKSVKFLLDPQTVNRFTAVIVLKKWVIEAIDLLMTDQDLKTDLPVLPRYKDLIWELSMLN